MKRNYKDRTFTAMVENKITEEGFWLEMQLERFNRLPADSVVEVFKCTSIKHFPERRFTKFNYRKRKYIRGCLELIRKEPKGRDEYWWHRLVH